MVNRVKLLWLLVFFLIIGFVGEMYYFTMPKPYDCGTSLACWNNAILSCTPATVQNNGIVTNGYGVVLGKIDGACKLHVHTENLTGGVITDRDCDAGIKNDFGTSVEEWCASSTQNASFYSSDPAKILVKRGSIVNGVADVKLQNATGGNIKITGVSGGCSISEGTAIASGGLMTLSCSAPDGTLGAVSINYIDLFGNNKSASISSR